MGSIRLQLWTGSSCGADQRQVIKFVGNVLATHQIPTQGQHPRDSPG